MTPTTSNTRRLFEHLRSATALLRLLVNDLESGESRYTFDMGCCSPRYSARCFPSGSVPGG